MTHLSCMTSPSRPRWDGSQIHFEITHDNEQIMCAISRAALEEISETRCVSAADLLRCFANARGRIEGLALEKLRARPAGIPGRLTLWADDMDFPPPGGASIEACQKVSWDQSALVMPARLIAAGQLHERERKSGQG
jgi:Protein of unknown function (DUF1488)